MQKLQKLHYVFRCKENLPCETQLFSLTDFVLKSVNATNLTKIIRKNIKFELFRPY